MAGQAGTRQFNAQGLMVNTASINAQSDINVRADLTGEVRVKFRSETFPLERFADSAAIQLINSQRQGAGAARARPPPPRPPAGRAAAAAPPPPPLRRRRGPAAAPRRSRRPRPPSRSSPSTTRGCPDGRVRSCTTR